MAQSDASEEGDFLRIVNLTDRDTTRNAIGRYGSHMAPKHRKLPIKETNIRRLITGPMATLIEPFSESIS